MGIMAGVKALRMLGHAYPTHLPMSKFQAERNWPAELCLPLAVVAVKERHILSETGEDLWDNE